jgi:hypothetical protein
VRREHQLKEIYRIAVEKGIAEDARDRAEIDRVLANAKKAYDKLDEDEQEFFDTEKFTNPYSDTASVRATPIRGARLLVGIDMEVGEVLLADRLREKGEPIDLIFAHHPEGPAFAGLHEVMYMQADLWAAQGVGIGAADALIDPRAQEIRRKIMPANHYRAPDAARLLGLLDDVVSHAGGQQCQRVRAALSRGEIPASRSRRSSRCCAPSPSTPTRRERDTAPHSSPARVALVPGASSWT